MNPTCQKNAETTARRGPARRHARAVTKLRRIAEVRHTSQAKLSDRGARDPMRSDHVPSTREREPFWLKVRQQDRGQIGLSSSISWVAGARERKRMRPVPAPDARREIRGTPRDRARSNNSDRGVTESGEPPPPPPPSPPTRDVGWFSLRHYIRIGWGRDTFLEIRIEAYEIPKGLVSYDR